MRIINSFEALTIPEKHQGFIRAFLSKLSLTDIIERVILFGSSAKGTIHDKSDIDLFIVTKRIPTANEEIYIIAECPPDYQSKYYIPADIIIKPTDIYEKYKYDTGMVQKYVELEGIDITGLLQECSGQRGDSATRI